MKKNLPKIILISLFLTIIFSAPLMYMFMPARTISEEENRVLETFDKRDLDGIGEKWFSGKLSRKLENYFSDQLPARTSFVRLHGICEAARTTRSGDVLVGRGGRLATAYFDAYISPTERKESADTFSKRHIAEQCEAVKKLGRSLSDKDIPLVFLPAPRNIDVTAADFGYPTDNIDKLDKIIENSFKYDKNVRLVNMLPTLRDRHAAGEYVYYKTDHHWTTRAAYYAYQEICKSLKICENTLSEKDFNVKTIADFQGTAASASGLFDTPLCPYDTIEIWEAKDKSDSDYVLSDGKDNTIMHGFIDEKYLGAKDKYGAFLSGTRNIVNVKKDTPESRRRRILVLKDSFANPVIPFLARHADLCVLNLSGGMTNATKYAEKFGADAVIILYNRENMICSDMLNMVK